MSLLAEIINDDAASSTRIEAMFFRAELYENQNRHDLAVKQLIAITKKGGDWSRRAEKKLKECYGHK